MNNHDLLESILNRLDLIYTLGLISIGLVVAVLVIYLLYRLLSYFF